MLLTKPKAGNEQVQKAECRDKTVDTSKVAGLRACNNHLQSYLYIIFRGCGGSLHAVDPTLWCLLFYPNILLHYMFYTCE